MAREEKSLQEEFDEFVTSVYPDPPKESDPATQNQYRQLRQAFFGGCLVAYASRRNYTSDLMSYREAVKMNIAFLGDQAGA